MANIEILRPKHFRENGERFAKIKVEFELEVFLGENTTTSPDLISITDVEKGIEDMELTHLGEILLNNIDLSKVITNDD